jgi:hypothetical protein
MLRSALVTSVDAFEVSLFDLERRKLRRVRVLGAQRAQRSDVLPALPRGPVGGEAKRGELVVSPLGDNL